MKNGWKRLLESELEEDYYKQLKTFLVHESKKNVIYPEPKFIYRAFEYVDYNDVKIVILGQDPYPSGQANGLAFAVNDGIKAPQSLANMFGEIYREYSKYPKSTTLKGWAKQGVFLLNTVLTVRANQVFSHRDKGWEKFTDCVIRHLNDRKESIIFMLWGAAAQSKEKLISNNRHHILKTSHPSPLSAHKGFLGCGHFKIANDLLADADKIDWIKS